MLKPWQVVQELESDNSRLFKESVVQREAAAGNDEFFKGAQWALDAMITFGIRKVEEKSGDGRGLKPETFWATAGQLSRRELTGNAAITAVNYMRLNATEDEWNHWYRRILIKDLRCGVSEKTVNSVVGKKYGKYILAYHLEAFLPWRELRLPNFY
jgi:DNA ligase-1